MQDRERQFVEAGISFSLTWGRIRIFRSTIQALGEPENIRFLLNQDCKSLAVQGRKRKTKECFAVPEYIPDKWGFTIYSLTFLESIWKLCGWERDKTYRTGGISYPEQELVAFDLEQSVALDDDPEAEEAEMC